MTTVDKSQRAALFVFLSLLTALIAGVVLYVRHSGRDETAVPLLAGCVLAAFLLIVAAARAVHRHRRNRELAAGGVRVRGLLPLMSLRQWLTMLVGLTVIAITTGAFTSVRLLTGSETPLARPTPVPATPTPAWTPEPVPTTADPIEFSATPTTPAEEPTELTEPTDPTPQPGGTKYLDNEDELEGDTDAEAVTFAAKRYPRGVTFYCSRATNSAVQWNVAGTTTFRATAGIDDNTGNSFGKVVEFLFYDQDGRPLTPEPVEVSLGHAKDIELKLTGVTSLRMTCAGRDAKTNEQRSTNASLGDPVVVFG